MNARIRTYTAYSVGVGIVWAVLLVLASLLDSAGRLSATIARYVYPPPKKYRPDTGQAP